MEYRTSELQRKKDKLFKEECYVAPKLPILFAPLFGATFDHRDGRLISHRK